jgi:hypothetical protein
VAAVALAISHDGPLLLRHGQRRLSTDSDMDHFGTGPLRLSVERGTRAWYTDKVYLALRAASKRVTFTDKDRPRLLEGTLRYTPELVDCAGCGAKLAKAAFSNSQWKKVIRGKKATCAACVISWHASAYPQQQQQQQQQQEDEEEQEEEEEEEEERESEQPGEENSDIELDSEEEEAPPQATQKQCWPVKTKRQRKRQRQRDNAFQNCGIAMSKTKRHMQSMVSTVAAGVRNFELEEGEIPEREVSPPRPFLHGLR